MPAMSATVRSLTMVASASAMMLHQLQVPQQTLDRVHGSPAGKASEVPMVQILENMADVQYTGIIEVGGQPLKAVVDTGSFELVVFGVKCKKCGTEKNLYSNGKSTGSYEPGSFAEEHSYGSGTTYSIDARDTVTIGSLNATRQIFWEVYDAEMPILQEDSFAAIFGVGPPWSSVKFAMADREEVHKELDEYRNSHSDIVPEEVQQVVDHYDEAVEHAMQATSFVEQINVENMSTCLGKSSGSNGQFIWHDVAARDSPELFETLNVIGDSYWSVSLSDVSVGHAVVSSDASHAMKDLAQTTELGCFTDEKCSAVIDTGTSLMVAPSPVVARLTDAINDWLSAGGTCDDISKLPDLEFKMNGKNFSLGPESYIGKAWGSLNEETRKFMPRRTSMQIPKDSQGSNCELLIMSMDAESQYGQLWIFGMPFFRKYYTTFRLSNTDSTYPKPYTISFSVQDGEQCIPSAAPMKEAMERSANSANNFDQHGKREEKKAQMNVDLSKVRTPRFLQRTTVEAEKLGAWLPNVFRI